MNEGMGGVFWTGISNNPLQKFVPCSPHRNANDAKLIIASKVLFDGRFQPALNVNRNAFPTAEGTTRWPPAASQIRLPLVQMNAAKQEVIVADREIVLGVLRVWHLRKAGLARRNLAGR